MNRPATKPILERLGDQSLKTPKQYVKRHTIPRKRNAVQLTPPPTIAKKAKGDWPELSKEIENNGKNDVSRFASGPPASDLTEAAKGAGKKHHLVHTGVSGDKRLQAGISDVGLSAKTINKLAFFRYQDEPVKNTLNSFDVLDLGQASSETSHHREVSENTLQHHAFICALSNTIVDQQYSSLPKEIADNDNALSHSPGQLDLDPPFAETFENYAILESDDEFPFDNGDVEGLLQLPMTEESFEPPSSLQIPFDDNSQTNEIYDPILQYSRPSSERSHHSIQIDGVKISVGNRTTFDEYQFSKSHSSAFFRKSPPCLNTNSDNEPYYYATDEDVDLLDDVGLNFFDLEPACAGIEEQQPVSPPKATPNTELPKLQWNPSTIYKPAKPLVMSEIAVPSSPYAELPKRQWNCLTSYESTKSLSSPKSIFPASTVTKPRSKPFAEISAQSKIPPPPPPAPHLINFDSEGNALPFARPTFPSLVLDRSPILGVSTSSFLRTCFRIGEALNVATQASYTNTHPLVELYARVTYSHRVGVEQFIQFADLFRSEKPPFLSGSFVGWKGVELWDHDSKAFLGNAGIGKVARCVGTIKRNETGKGWKMMVLSIWEANWEDVGYVKGVACS